MAELGVRWEIEYVDVRDGEVTKTFLSEAKADRYAKNIVRNKWGKSDTVICKYKVVAVGFSNVL